MEGNDMLVCPDRILAPGERLARTERRSLSVEALHEIVRLAERYPSRLSAVIPALHVAQADLGFVGLDAMREVARALDVPESHVYGVASFYTLFQKKAVGRFHLQVCTNICCALRGGDRLFARVCELLSLRPGEVSADGMWSVEEVECLGSCGSGPCMQVNDDLFEEFLDNAGDAGVNAVLEACRNGQRPSRGEEDKAAWNRTPQDNTPGPKRSEDNASGDRS